MKTNLDNINKNERESFDNILPPMGHFERFNERLEQRARNRTKQFIRRIFATAAAAIITLLLLFRYAHVETYPSSEPDAVAEVISFYNVQVNEEFEQIEKELCHLDAVSRNELLTDMETMKNDSAEFASRNPDINDEAYIAAIITHYKAQLESLEHIRFILQKTQQENHRHRV